MTMSDARDPPDRPAGAQHRCRARGEVEARQALRPLRHLLLPDLHDRRPGHPRRGRQPGRPGVRLADRPRRLLLPAVRDAHRGARFHLPRRGRLLHLDQVGPGTADRLRQRGHVLDRQPDLAGWDARPSRRTPASRRSSGTRPAHGTAGRQDGPDHLRPCLHLGRDLVSDPLVRHRQVDPDHRRMGTRAAAHRLHAHGRRVRGEARRARRRRADFKPTWAPSSSRPSPCCSSTSSASSCRTPPATR